MIQECQIMIWAPPTLKESDWLRAGFEDLKAYVKSLKDENDKALKTSSADMRSYIPTLPLLSFGYLDNGEKVQSLVCPTLDDLPTDSIPNVIEFDGNPIQR